MLRRRALALVLAATALVTGSAGATTASGATPLAAVTSMTPAGARADKEVLWTNGCYAWERTTRLSKTCAFGATGSSRVIALVGDSHAAHLFPAFAKIAKAQGWKLYVMVKVSCPFIDAKVSNLALGRVYTECATWNAWVVNRLNRIKPDLVVVSMSRFAIHPAQSGLSTWSAKGTAVGREINKIASGISTALVVDTIDGGRDIPGCLAAHRSDIRACAITKTRALSGSLGTLERYAGLKSRSTVINLTSAYCSSWPCLPVRNRAIMFRDSRHLTETFARTLSTALTPRLTPLMP